MGRRLAGDTVAEKLALNHRIDGACWRWLGAHNSRGYGHLSVEGRTRSVHQLAFELAYGPVPAGLEIDHTCRVRDCINPAHLDAVTHAENVRRTAARRTRCRAGHRLTPGNVARRRAGNGRWGRACRICLRTARRAARADRGEVRRAA